MRYRALPACPSKIRLQAVRPKRMIQGLAPCDAADAIIWRPVERLMVQTPYPLPARRKPRDLS